MIDKIIHKPVAVVLGAIIILLLVGNFLGLTLSAIGWLLLLVLYLLLARRLWEFSVVYWLATLAGVLAIYGQIYLMSVQPSFINSTFLPGFCLLLILCGSPVIVFWGQRLRRVWLACVGWIMIMLVFMLGFFFLDILFSLSPRSIRYHRVETEGAWTHTMYGCLDYGGSFAKRGGIHSFGLKSIHLILWEVTEEIPAQVGCA